MKSDVIHINGETPDIEKALAQAEAVAAFKKLDVKQTLQLRLLAEETMGMMRGLTNEYDADFWIEDEENAFQVHLKTLTVMNTELRKKLISNATTGKNASTKGVMGKIREIFERAIEPLNDTDDNFFSAGLMYASEDPVNFGYTGDAAMWSFNKYRESIQEDEAPEEWDELERSIVANIADEIRVGIRGNEVEMIIYKKF